MTFKRLLPLITLLTIIVLAGFLRLYRIGDYMGFLGDEGRDALVVKRMIVNHTFTLLGPITSVGLMHLGPAYYYFMAPFLWAFHLDPVGPAVMVAFFSLATIILIWKLVKRYFGMRAALIASVLYGLAPLVIIYSHSSWNPNILPFFATLIIYSFLRAAENKNVKWILIAGLSFGIAVQLHYVALIFLPVFILALFLLRDLPKFKSFIIGLVGSLVTFSPFILFEMRHDFINIRTILQFVTRGGNAKTFGFENPLFKFWDLFIRLFWRLLIVENAQVAIISALILLATLFILIHREKKRHVRNFFILLFLWIGVGLVSLSFYTGGVYDYYLMFAFPVPFILAAIFFSTLSRSLLGKVTTFTLVLSLIVIYMQHTPILSPPNRLAFQTAQIADFILQQTQGQPYNFALIASGNSDHGYRYFLEIHGSPPVVIENTSVDPTRKTVQSQLFVVCEEVICQPLGHPLWEIAGFGQAQIADQWKVGLFRVFKLIHYIKTDTLK